MAEILNPQDAELEEVILGACLIGREAMPMVADRLRPEMFYFDKNALIYAAMQVMYREGRQIDIITVKNELVARGKLDAAGGPYELTRISGRVASAVHLEYHVLILREKYLRREMILGFHKLLALAADETTDIGDTLVDAHNLLDRLEGECGTIEHLRDMDTLMDDTLQQVDARRIRLERGYGHLHRSCRPGSPDFGLATGRPECHCRPSCRGQDGLCPASGTCAATAGHHVAVYSLEMQGERLGDRWLIAASPDVNARHLRSGQLTDDEVAQVRTAASELRVLPIHVDDHPVTSMDRVRSSARMLQSKGKCDLIILDYLQLCDMKSDQKNRNREQEVAQTTRKAKLMAKELNVPVLLLSQLNRGSDGRPFSRPILSDLRESGAIEQDADMVMLLYRPALAGIRTEPVSKYPSEHLGVVIVAKHRNGETGDVYFAHNPSMTKLGEYVPPTEWLMRNANDTPILMYSLLI